MNRSDAKNAEKGRKTGFQHSWQVWAALFHLLVAVEFEAGFLLEAIRFVTESEKLIEQDGHPRARHIRPSREGELVRNFQLKGFA